MLEKGPPRKRWDRLPKGSDSVASRPRPPFPAVLSDVIWIVSRLDGERIRPFMPPTLRPTDEMVGVLGMYNAPKGSGVSPYMRLFGGVAVQGHQAPDSRDAIYVVGDLVTADALEPWRDNYIDTCLTGEPRMWWVDDVLHGAIGAPGEEWLHVVVRPNGPRQHGVVGQDAYLSRSRRGLVRHVVSYFGALAAADVLSLEISEHAPSAFTALKPKEILIGLCAQGLHATWGESRALLPEPGPNVDDGDLRPLSAGLVAVGLTPAEARLAALYGNGRSAREAAKELGISEHTAKSTLKQVYGKLGVRKQSELGRLIARLS